MESTLSNIEETLDMFEKKGLKTDIAMNQVLPFFEKLVLIRALDTKKIMLG